MFGWILPLRWSSYEASERYQEADKFNDDYEPKDGREYDWILRHTMSVYDKATENVRLLDKKAEGIIQYLAPGTGLVGLAVAWTIHSSTGNPLANWFVGAGLLCMVLSMVAAFLSLLPHQQTIPPSAHETLPWIDLEEPGWGTPEKPKAVLASGVHMSMITKTILADFKANRLSWAYALLILGIVSVVTGVFLTLVLNGGC